MSFKIEDPVIIYKYPFAFEQFLHQVFMPEMMLSGQDTVTVYNPVCRYVFWLKVGGIHGPANHSR